MPCLGVTYGFGLIASVVVPLCPEGNINDYVRDHPHANKLDLVRLRPALIYCALANLSRTVIASRQRRCLSPFKRRSTWEDLRSESCVLTLDAAHIYLSLQKNIVVAPNGCPLITDAGLAQAIRSQEGIFPWATPSQSLRWQAPETFGPDLDDAYTTSSDVWSLAMTILEVMSGRAPYYPRRQIHATAFAIMDGVLPKRPDNDTVSDGLWDVLRTSWAKNPSDRPCAAFVRRQLEALRADNLYHLYKL